MLPPTQRDRLDLLLVSPRNPLNIGAAARAMANFGFERLTIVAPFATNWMEAKSAVGAPELLRHARVCETLAEAVRDATLVLGTGSLDRRRPEQALLGLPEGAALIRQTLAAAENESPVGPAASRTQTARVALLFGSEKHGLTSDDLAWCHGLITIETSEAQPSMNLGQSVAVILYEISRLDTAPDAADGSHLAVQGIRSGCGIPRPSPQDSARIPVGAFAGDLANSAQLDRLAELIEETMAAVNYQTRGLRSANGHALRILLRRLMPRDADLRRIMGLFRRILWQLRHQNDQK